MSAFTYRGGILHADDLPLPALAEQVGTPAYIYSATQIRRNYRAYATAFDGDPVDVAFALKANSNQSVIRLLASEGAGADVVSGGELTRALAAGVAPGRIVFSGVGKSKAELAQALQAGIHQINVESSAELEMLNAVALEQGARARIALRVNPDVDAGTHAKISTGRKENKFGIDWEHAHEAFARARSLPGIDPVAVAVHIGSQLTRLEPFRAAYTRVAELVASLRGIGVNLDRIDLGGGIGVVYHNESPPDLNAYAEIVRDTVGNLGCRITLEPGRSLVADAGILLARVIYVKEGLHRRFLILDAAMNDLVRPAMYGSWHTLLPVTEAAKGVATQPTDIVGPVCESGDTFAEQREMPPLAQGELVAFLTAGAYGAVMASEYNTRPLAPEVLVEGSRHAIVKPRPTLDEILAREPLAPWL